MNPDNYLKEANRRLVKVIDVIIKNNSDATYDIMKMLNLTAMGLNLLREGSRTLPNALINRVVEKYRVNPIYLFTDESEPMFVEYSDSPSLNDLLEKLDKAKKDSMNVPIHSEEFQFLRSKIADLQEQINQAI